MTKVPRLSRLGVLAPAALSACIDASVLAAPAAGAILSTVLRELSKAFMLKKWFHGVMTASEAEHLLMLKGKNGSYLVRESQTHHGEFVLSVRVRGRVSHVKIRKEHNKYNVGSGEEFDDLSELIEHCRAYPLIETSGDVLRLMQPVNYPWASNKPRAMNSIRNETYTTSTTSEKINEGAGCSSMDQQSHRDTIYEEGSDDSEGQDQDLSPNLQGPLGNLTRPLTSSEVLRVEYESIRCAESHTTFSKSIAELRENRFLNRYQNVLPYNETRVRLLNSYGLPNEVFNDYINASYIVPMEKQGKPKKAVCESPPKMLSYAGLGTVDVGGLLDEEIHLKFTELTLEPSEEDVPLKKKYIATQGCLWSTMKAFWQMILDNDVRIIVMLNDVIENGKRKCEKYWPIYGTSLHYHDINITNIDEEEGPFYTYRRFKVEAGTGKITYVYQFQYKTWPDHDVPADTAAILKLIEDVNQQKLWDKLNAPAVNTILVHCSAGIGRTGTFIALDMLLDQLKADGIETPIDIRSVVKLCRAQRAGMVQNFKQYEFLYQAVQDYINPVRETQRGTDTHTGDEAPADSAV